MQDAFDETTTKTLSSMDDATVESWPMVKRVEIRLGLRATLEYKLPCGAGRNDFWKPFAFTYEFESPKGAG
jgi:hypothetical protein